MMKVINPSEIDSVIGTEVGVSDWVLIDQDRINKFADATMDHQFIHVDPEQATPVFGSTIAHGFLSLSLVAGIPFDQEIGLVLEGTKMGLNYGLDKVRFLSPVPVDSEVRIRMKCIDISEKNPGQDFSQKYQCISCVFLLQNLLGQDLETLPCLVHNLVPSWCPLKPNQFLDQKEYLQLVTKTKNHVQSLIQIQV